MDIKILKFIKTEEGEYDNTISIKAAKKIKETTIDPLGRMENILFGEKIWVFALKNRLPQRFVLSIKEDEFAIDKFGHIYNHDTIKNY